MAYHGPPGPPGLMPPSGMYPHHPSYPPPQMMMGMPPMQHMPPGLMPPPQMSMHPGMTPHMMVVPPVLSPHIASSEAVKVPIASSTAHMKVATTVFVGNISEKASDTLIRQILLRCGAIDGWKRVQDATGKLQGFGFCEYADPDATLRALRLLHNLKLGDKPLVAKVDAKTRKELLKYVITKKHLKQNKSVVESEVDREVEKLEEDKDVATAALITEVTDDAKREDGHIQDAICNLLKDYLSILSSTKSNEDIQRERDVKESILFMAKQSGSIDPDSTLEDMDMEDDMKTLVSDEIKRFRESYKRSDDARKDKKYRDRDRDRDRDRERDRGDGERGHDREKERDEERGRPKSETDPPQAKEKPKRERSRSRSPVKSSSSPLVRTKSPVRSRSQERQEKEKRRVAMRLREKEDMVKDESDYDERMRQRRLREREKAYRQRLGNWEGREYRKGKDLEKEAKREKDRKEEMDRERKHLGDFLSEYDDNKDDQKYYRGNAFARRRRDHEMEIDNDERDRMREKDELEELRLQVIERQAREILSGDPGQDRSGEESPSRAEEEEEEEDIGVKEELEEDIPLTKSGYTSGAPAFPPIQVHSAPSVHAPDTSGFVLVPADSPPSSSSLLRKNGESGKQEHSEGNSPASYNSPTQAKLAFGLKKTPISGTAPSTLSVGLGLGQAKSSKLEKIFATEEDEVEKKPKKKLVPIDYSDEDGEGGEAEERSPGGGDARRKRSRRSSGGRSSSRRSSSNHHGSSSSSKGGGGDVGMVARGSAGEGLMALEEVKDRKLTSEERKKMTQTLVNNIPTAKEEVFQYQLKWDQIDKGLIDKRVCPWINKKIAEYIGEPEPILTEFICNKLSCHISPDDILNDISMVLDDEAEVFILKLWRLLIYETEAKHLGIAKSY